MEKTKIIFILSVIITLIVIVLLVGWASSFIVCSQSNHTTDDLGYACHIILPKRF